MIEVGTQMYLGNHLVGTYVDGVEVFTNTFGYEEISLITDGLIYYIDAAVPSSYPGSGGFIYDISNSALTMSLVNGATYSSVSSSFALDGVNDFIDNYNAPFTVNITTKTMIAWCKLDNVSQQGGGIIGIKNTSNVFDTITYNETDQGWGFGSDFFNRTFWTGVKETSTEDWVMITGVYESGTNGYKMYRQDQLIGQGTKSVYNFTTNVDYSQGVRLAPSVGFIDGYIPNGLIYNRALSAEEVSQTYNYFKGRFGL